MSCKLETMRHVLPMWNYEYRHGMPIWDLRKGILNDVILIVRGIILKGVLSKILSCFQKSVLGSPSVVIVELWYVKLWLRALWFYCICDMATKGATGLIKQNKTKPYDGGMPIYIPTVAECQYILTVAKCQYIYIRWRNANLKRLRWRNAKPYLRPVLLG